jgi:SAM-dependent methyltransferase
MSSAPRVEPRAYALPHVVRDFAGRDALYPAELAALAEVWPSARGDVLDVGVGGGRTTRYLCGAARTYRAIDYQPEMVAACRRRFPGVAVDVGDARELNAHDDASYDLFFFSFNGIDYISHDDRPRVFAEAFRLLRPGGAFVYSSHNLRPLRGALPGAVWPHLDFSLNPAVLAVRAARAGASAARILRNRQRFASQQHMGDGWAAVNDEAYEHAMLTVYVDPAREPEHLAAAGFTSDVMFLGMDGRIAEPTLDDAWVHFITRKPG